MHAHLGGQINFRVKSVKEPLLGRKCADRDNALKQLAETREDRGACVRLHPSQVSSRIQVANCKRAIYIAKDRSGNEEQRENYAEKKTVNGVGGKDFGTTDATVMMDAAKVASDALTACRELAKDESTVSMS